MTLHGESRHRVLVIISVVGLLGFIYYKKLFALKITEVISMRYLQKPCFFPQKVKMKKDYQMPFYSSRINVYLQKVL